ncbi:ATP-binding protein [Bacillus songklensis]|uniref:Signal transduction histidine-protein kinase ArlS n=1 Tax=Bacillus songklensis TaxID=1069116 RepID=A0ABV8AZ57_9BACI
MKRFRNASLKWKFMILSSVTIFVSFFLFTFLQYHIVYNWMLKQEEKMVGKTLEELVAFYDEKSPGLTKASIRKSHSFIEALNEKNQRITVMDEAGRVIADVSNDVSPSFNVRDKAIKKRERQHYYVDNDHAIIMRAPVMIEGKKGTIQVVRQLERFDQITNAFFTIMTFFGMGAVVISSLLGWLISKQFLAPINDLTRMMKSIKRKGFQQRMEKRDAKDELSELTNMFNGMMDEIEGAFEQQKQFVEDASHEFRTPIAVLEGHLRLLKRWGKQDPVILEESLDAALYETNRLKHLVLELLELSRAENIRVVTDEEVIELNETAGKIVKNVAAVQPHFTIDFHPYRTPLYIRITEHHFSQILMIVLDNAIKYSPMEKWIRVEITDDEDKVDVLVSDWGIGISAEEIGKVFQRFYRVDKARSREKGGSGLGLAIAKKMMEKYNGRIDILSREEKGTTVKLSFPKEEMSQ